MNKGIRILPDIISHYVVQIQIRKQSTLSLIMIFFLNSCAGHNAGWTVYKKKINPFLNACIWFLVLSLREQPEICKLKL